MRPVTTPPANAKVPSLGGYVAKQCPVRAQLDLDADVDRSLRVETTAAERARMDAGREFEKRIFAVLSTVEGAEIIQAATRAEAQEETAAAIERGATVIAGADLPDDVENHRTGKPDVLVRVGGSSGPDGWLPVEVKHHRLTEPAEGSSLAWSDLLEGVLDPNSATEVDGIRFRRGKLREDALQLAHYWRMLEGAGLTPSSGQALAGVIDRDERLWWVDLSEPRWRLWWSEELVSTLDWYDHEFAFRVDVVANTLRRNLDPALPRTVVPVWTAECRTCPWRNLCRTELESADHVSLLPGSTYDRFVRHRRIGTVTRADVAQLDPNTAWVMHGDRSSSTKVDLATLVEEAAAFPIDAPVTAVLGKKRTAIDRLATVGISTVADLARLDAGTLAYQGARIGHLPTVIDHARAAVSGQPWRARGIDVIEVPRADVEVDVDMESSEDGVYLWGAAVTDEGNTQYIPFVTWTPLTPELEAEVFAKFWAWLTDLRDLAVAEGRTFAAYHYSSAENTEMRRIVRASSGEVPPVEAVEDLIASDEWVDLRPVAGDQIVTGHGLGLKNIAPLAGFAWRDDDPGGDASTAWYRDAVTNPDSSVRADNQSRLLRYNEDDVLATVAVRTWLTTANLPSIENWPSADVQRSTPIRAPRKRKAATPMTKPKRPPLPSHATGRNVEQIIADLRSFRDAWWTFDGTERAASQTFLNQLVQCYTGLPDVMAAGAAFEQFGSRDKGSGYMDLHWPEVCIVEMKAPPVGRSDSRWDKAVAQALEYWRNSADIKRGIPAPRFLVICSFHRFEVWEPGRFPNAPIDEFSIEELPDHYGSLNFFASREPDVGGPGQQLSAEAAQCLADVYFMLLDRHAADPETLRRFILQATWCLFAEDLGMLPGKPVERLLRALVKDPTRSSATEIGGFFYALNVHDQRDRDDTGFDGLPYVNGGLFENATRVRLNPNELAKMIDAAGYDWRAVNPTIFGGLMEACLGHDRRWELGAHYTFEQDIMSIVEPTIVRPWRHRIDAAASPTEADTVLADIAMFRVLDPACGCGNFIAIAYRELRHLTAQALDRRDRLYQAAGATPPQQRPYYPLSGVHGIEIEPFAVQIARVTLWMTHKLVADQYGLAEPVLPLVDLSNIVCADALKTEWPEVEAIIGNPPFHGSQNLRSALGDDYVEWLKTLGAGLKDYCVYWFRKAHECAKTDSRVGLVGTNSISQNRARGASLEYVTERGGVITDAISTKVWPGDAKVHVSIVNWVKRPAIEPTLFTLDGVPVAGITTSLRPGGIERTALKLSANQNRCFQGGKTVGDGFVLDDHAAQAILADDTADYSAVIRRFLTSDDIANTPGQEPTRWVIDFNRRPLEEAAWFPLALDHLRATVRDMRATNSDRYARENWWLHGRPVLSLREGIAELPRYVAGTRTGKRLLLTWCRPDWFPSDAVNAFAFSDDFAFGVLSSAIHSAWAWKQSSTLKGDLRYTPTTAFATFPFPTEPAGFRAMIEDAAREVVALRRHHTTALGKGLTALYNAMDEGAYTDLAAAHGRLDRAVCDAYGWHRSTLDSHEAIAEALLALNSEIASGLRAYDPFA